MVDELAGGPSAVWDVRRCGFPPRDREGAESLLAPMLAHARARNASLLSYWRRTPSDGTRLFLGGPDVSCASDVDGLEAMLFPIGARGVRVDPDLLAEYWSAAAFVPVVAEHRSLRWSSGGRRGANEAVTAALEHVLRAWNEGELHLIAQCHPVDGEIIEVEASQCAHRLNHARGSRSSESTAFEIAMLEERLGYLEDAQEYGMWTVSVRVGADTTELAERAAAMVVSVCMDAGDPTRLRLGEPGGDPSCTSEPVSWRALTGLFRPPRVPLTHTRLLTAPSFGTTCPDSGPALALGRVIDPNGEPVGECRIPLRSLLRHTAVFGQTGFGKTQTIKNLVLRAAQQGIPTLVIEPTKDEYEALAGRLADHGGLGVIKPGDPDSLLVGLNPLEPEPGFPVQAHLDLTRTLFATAYEMLEPFPQILRLAMTRLFERMLPGGDLGMPAERFASWPTLAELQAEALEVIDELRYGTEVRSNLLGFVTVRMSSLSDGAPGNFFNAPTKLDVGQLLNHNMVINLDRVTSNEDKAFMVGAILIRIFEHLQMQHRADPERLSRLFVIEEAHRLLRSATNSHSSRSSVEVFAEMLAEIRAYGTGVVVAEQIPSKIIPDALKNTAVKIIHRLPASDDRGAVGAAMSMSSEQLGAIARLRPGEAIVSIAGDLDPMLVSMPDETDVLEEQLCSQTNDVVERCVAREPLASLVTRRDLARVRSSIGNHAAKVAYAELAVLGSLLGKRWPDHSTVRALEDLSDRQLRYSLEQHFRAVVSCLPFRTRDHVTTNELHSFLDHQLDVVFGSRARKSIPVSVVAPWVADLDDDSASGSAGKRRRRSMGLLLELTSQRSPGRSAALADADAAFGGSVDWLFPLSTAAKTLLSEKNWYRDLQELSRAPEFREQVREAGQREARWREGLDSC